jgi:hypothetical protein
MNSYLSKYLGMDSENTLEISELKKMDNQIEFNYKVEGNVTGKSLKIALAIKKKETKVKRGENSGRMLSSVNIVVEQIEISLNKTSGSGIIKIPELVENGDSLTLIGFTQSQNFDITAAAQENI